MEAQLAKRFSSVKSKLIRTYNYILYRKHKAEESGDAQRAASFKDKAAMFNEAIGVLLELRDENKKLEEQLKGE
jgi:hypothetical protein